MATTSIPHRWKYDVFVSFRGEDIRKNFMDHMFNDFKQKGIHAFRDDSELPKGEEISPHLYKAIEESRFLIVIFSKNYASSTWCLRELVKILECKQIKDPKHEPDVVRRQKRSYAKAFVKHDVSNRTEVDKWREALSMAANLSGWDLQDMTNGYEYKFIDSISKDILKKLCDGPLHVGENLVGIDFHFDKLNLSRFVGSHKVNMLGICGISGIGKTTLAKAIYNLMYVHFEDGSCFCEDVKEKKSLTQVQMHMIRKILKTYLEISNVGEGSMEIKRRMACKRILLVLDDVNNVEQLEALAGSRVPGSREWFSPGSLIIFTCKDKQLLRSHRVDEDDIHDMDFLDRDRSLELFRSYAFKEKDYSREFEKVSEKVVDYVRGHPMALKHLGGFLYGKTVDVWDSELKRLKVRPNEKIQQVLHLSYDGLDFYQKNILLDIACLFVGENRDFVASVLDGCNFFAVTNMQVLVDKSLITISSDMSLQMHDLIQAMAREIVRERRLCISSASSEKEVAMTEAVEVLVILLRQSSQKVDINANSFALMKNLRILKIYSKEEFHQKVELKGYNVKYSGSLKNLNFLSNKLSLFYWHGCPFNYLPPEFYPKNIVAIDLSHSNIKQLWTTPQCLRRLKIMKLRYCCNLTTTPDFSETTNLEELDLEGCVNLATVHPSIGMLNKLAVLNLKDCPRVGSFPEAFWSRCWTSISGFIWNQQHPQRSVSLAGLNMLKSLNFNYCNLVQVPDGIGGLSCLKELKLEGNNLLEIPESIGGLSRLILLNLKGNNFTSLPGSLSQLSSLGWLNVDGCKKLEVLPELPPSVWRINASHCTSLCSIKGSNPIMRKRYTNLTDCPKFFKVSTSETQSLDSSVTSQGSRFSSFLRYAHNRCGLFRLPGSSIENMDMFYDGNRIPNCFTNKSKGNQVKVELPSDWSFSKFRGYGICVVLKRKKPSPDFGYYVKNFDGADLGECNDCNPYYQWDYFKGKPIRIDESHMIWLHYTNDIEDMEEAKNFVTFCFDENEKFEVKECGVRVVCDEEADLIMFQDIPTLSQHGLALYRFREYGYITWTW
ncbi:NB-ARC domains-containing protein [Artemisia annua]|uniref:ADP-ribosyl cyclase/cyclic ADP-ribose hydrolase n=1 Tax=Artemisia annua TaxID=35608 RepID=A0A2U1KQK8_ARTAN|nr:NB-ARC domains-containing protein [Artemisia annua]